MLILNSTFSLGLHEEDVLGSHMELPVELVLGKFSVVSPSEFEFADDDFSSTGEITTFNRFVTGTFTLFTGFIETGLNTGIGGGIGSFPIWVPNGTIVDGTIGILMPIIGGRISIAAGGCRA